MITNYLYPEQSFTRGVASISNIRGKLSFNYSETEEQADYEAIFRDWKVVENDIRKALKDYGEKATKEERHL